MSNTPARDKIEEFGFDRICELTAECVSMRKIADEIGVSWATLGAYVDADIDRSEQYARAREAQADKFAEEILQISDDGANDTYETENGTQTNQDVIARSRLRVDARKWLASKMAPKKYGDKLTTETKIDMTMRKAADLTDDELAQYIASQQTKS